MKNRDWARSMSHRGRVLVWQACGSGGGELVFLVGDGLDPEDGVPGAEGGTQCGGVRAEFLRTD